MTTLWYRAPTTTSSIFSKLFVGGPWGAAPSPPKYFHVCMLVLYLQGLPNERITFTKDTDNVVPKWPADIRLVDDRSVMYGRLQMLYKGKWRGVCANSEK